MHPDLPIYLMIFVITLSSVYYLVSQFPLEPRMRSAALLLFGGYAVLILFAVLVAGTAG